MTALRRRQPQPDGITVHGRSRALFQQHRSNTDNRRYLLQVGSPVQSSRSRAWTALPSMLRLLGRLPLGRCRTLGRQASEKPAGRKPRDRARGNVACTSLWGFEIRARGWCAAGSASVCPGRCNGAARGGLRNEPDGIERRRWADNTRCRCSIRPSVAVAGRGRSAQAVSMGPG